MKYIVAQGTYYRDLYKEAMMKEHYSKFGSLPNTNICWKTLLNVNFIDFGGKEITVFIRRDA
jgi:hypothetical protein